MLKFPSFINFSRSETTLFCLPSERISLSILFSAIKDSLITSLSDEKQLFLIDNLVSANLGSGDESVTD